MPCVSIVTPAPDRPSSGNGPAPRIRAGVSVTVSAVETRLSARTVRVRPSPMSRMSADERTDATATNAPMRRGEGPRAARAGAATPRGAAHRGIAATREPPSSPAHSASQVPSRTTRASAAGSRSFSATNGMAPRRDPCATISNGLTTEMIRAWAASSPVSVRPRTAAVTMPPAVEASIDRYSGSALPAIRPVSRGREGRASVSRPSASGGVAGVERTTVNGSPRPPRAPSTSTNGTPRCRGPWARRAC